MDPNKDSIEERSRYFLDQIDQIKSIFSGRDNFYLLYTHNGLHYSQDKTNHFCNELIEILAAHIQETEQDIDERWSIFYESFLSFVFYFVIYSATKMIGFLNHSSGCPGLFKRMMEQPVLQIF